MSQGSQGAGSAAERGAPARVVEFWTRQHQREDLGTHDNFLVHPLVQGYLSLRAVGGLLGLMEAVVNQVRDRTRPGARLFSPGCGYADKERILAAAFPDREFVAMDITPEILARARAETERQGLRNLRFEPGDFNRLALEPRSFDAVLGLGSIHHVEALEGFWEGVRRALRPGGVVLAQEFVGPNRMQWNAAQVREGSRALAQLVPEEHKVHHRAVQPVDLAFLIANDPSEAVRSSEILPTLRAAGFSVPGYAGAGCALLQPVLMHQIHTFDPRNWEHNHVLMTLFREEDRLMRAGVLGDDFAMFVAVPPA
jgi:SAM-dependent methyltransferase